MQHFFLLNCYSLDPHGECIDVFVKLVKKTDGLDYHIVCSVHVEFDLCPRVAVAQTKLGFSLGLKGQTLDQSVEVIPQTYVERVNSN